MLAADAREAIDNTHACGPCLEDRQPVHPRQGMLAEAQVDGVYCLGHLCLGDHGHVLDLGAHLSGWFWNASGKT